MLIKHIVGYLPSLVIPALTSFAAVYCYTRLLSPEQYGQYALIISTMTLLSAVCFYWLQVAVPRLLPYAIKEGTELAFRATVQSTFSVISFVLIVGVWLFTTFLHYGDTGQILRLAVPLALVRSFLNINQAFHRSTLDFKRYNLIECMQAVLGLILGFFLIYGFHMGSEGAVFGMVIAMACLIPLDARQWVRASFAHFSHNSLTLIRRFGVPLTLTYGLAFIIAASDRFLIEYFRNASEVGVYAAGFSLMDRITTIMFMMTALPALPLAVAALEKEGVAAAQKQLADNGAVMLAFALPTLAGLILTNHALAFVIIGSEFREGAIRVMPYIAAAAFLNGFATHYFDHAVHLAKKSTLTYWTKGPAALLNLVMNLILIPRYGYMGAAYASVASYGLLFVLSLCIGLRAFPFRLPMREALRILGATVCMMLVLHYITFTDSIIGLALMIGLGVVTYTTGLWVFNVLGVRSNFLKSSR